MRAAPLLLWAIGLFACVHGPPGLRAADERSLRRLERLARNQLDCPDVLVGALNEVVYRAEGCGRLAEFSHVCAGRRCHWDALVPVLSRAAARFACPIDNLEERVLHPGLHEVAGCGRLDTYRIVCLDTTCQWVTEPRAEAPVLVLDTSVEIAIPGTAGASTDDLVLPPSTAGAR